MKSIISGQNQPFESVMAQEQETHFLKQLEQILQSEDSPPKLVTAKGEEITLTDSICRVLHQAVHLIASGKVVSIVAHEQELTTQQAADLLNVSRPYLIKLLENGDIPHIMVGTHRRVNYQDLMEYKQRRDIERRKLLQELIEITEEAGLYEIDE